MLIILLECNDRESFKRDKFLESKSENSLDVNEENLENLDKNNKNDLVETSDNENKAQKLYNLSRN